VMIRWTIGARREFHELPIDHHAHAAHTDTAPASAGE
jgi:hypothetical protein